jgi:hypothetical protein
MASSGDPLIEEWFPNLRPDDYQFTSPEDATYNCVAWAAGKTDAWWEPIQAPGYYWPDDAPWDDRVESLVCVFKLLGFEECSSDAPEPGYDKVAIYSKGHGYEHIARQLPGGKWTSKLGSYNDLEHTNLPCLTGDWYGSVVTVLRKSIGESPGPHAPPQQAENRSSQTPGEPN